MKTKEQLAEEFAKQFIDLSDENSDYEAQAALIGFLAGYGAATKHLTEFQAQVTDKDHRASNFWFEREFIQKDSDGKFAW